MEKTVDAMNGIVVYELKNFDELTMESRKDVRAELDNGNFIGVKVGGEFLLAAIPSYAIFNRNLGLSQVRCFNFLSRLDHALWRALHTDDRDYAQLDRN